MSAVAREITCALQSHPNAPEAGARVLLSCDSSLIFQNVDFGESVRDVLDSSLLLEEVEASHLLTFCEEKQDEQYDAAVFSNVLTSQKMIGNKKNMAELLEALLGVLKPGAVVILRENLDQYSAQLISEITKFLDVFATSKDNKVCGFEFYGMNQVQDSMFVHNNFLDVFWTMSTKSSDSRSSSPSQDDQQLSTYREFLDRTQYTEDNVIIYEWIFGDNFISPGGIDENRRVLKHFQRLKPGQKMLDIGVGIGGGARQVAKEFGVHVLGCDLSSNMILHAFERNHRDKDHRVEYIIADAMVYKYEPNAFDAVFSRDCIHHIENINILFKKIFDWLKPGGQLLLTMYGKGYGILKPKFLEYVKQRQYYLKNLEEFRQLAQDTGFINIYTENNTNRFKEILMDERQKAVENKDDFVKKFGELHFNKLIQSWEDKLQFIKDDNHNWLLLRADKPLH